MDNKLSVNGDANAPIAGTRANQANGDGSIVAGGGVNVQQTDSRNFGTSLAGVKIGNGSTLNVTTSDPALAALAMDLQRQTAQDSLLSNAAVSAAALDTGRLIASDSIAGQAQIAAAALNANNSVSQSALASNLGALTQSLATVQANNADAWKTQRDAMAALNEADKRRERITTEAINAGLDMGRQASSSAEETVRNALTKLAEQRAPDGANLVKVALWVVAAVALVFGLRALPRLFRRPTAPRS